MFLYYLVNTWKTKRSWLKKTLSRLAGLTHLLVFLQKISFRLDGISAKFSETHLDELARFSYECIIFLRKVRSHLGELARLTRSALLHMNSLLKVDKCINNIN